MLTREQIEEILIESHEKGIPVKHLLKEREVFLITTNTSRYRLQSSATSLLSPLRTSLSMFFKWVVHLWRLVPGNTSLTTSSSPLRPSAHMSPIVHGRYYL